MVHLDYRDSRPIYAQIVDGFREQITGGVLRPGEKLPSVRDLAAQLAINPNTIQRAYRRLEAEGWIATVPGKGCFVCGDGEIREREKKRLLLSFDEAAAALLTLGASHGETDFASILSWLLSSDVPCVRTVTMRWLPYSSCSKASFCQSVSLTYTKRSAAL